MLFRSKYGFSDFILATGYLNDKIDEYINVTDFGASVKTVFTGIDSNTGGRLLFLKNYIESEIFMVTYGDGLSSINLQQLLSFHLYKKKLATITAVHPPARFGFLSINNEDLVTEFREKKQTDTGWINGGFFVFNREIFNYISDLKSELEKEPLENLTKDRQLSAYRHEGFWQCMDTYRDKIYLNELCKSGVKPWL